MKAYVAWTEREGDAILISIPALGIVTEAASIEQVATIAEDAVEGYLMTARASGIPVPAPTVDAASGIVLVAVSDLVRWDDPIVFAPDRTAA